MYIPTRDEIRAAHRQGEGATIQLFEHLARELQALQEQKQQQNPFQRWVQKDTAHQKPEKAGQQKEWRAGGACYTLQIDVTRVAQHSPM